MGATLPIGSSGGDVWPALLTPVVVYLAAAALAEPSTAWPVLGGVMAILVVSKVLGTQEWWALVVGSLAFVVAAVVRGRAWEGGDLLQQLLLFLILGGFAVAADHADVRIGGILVAAGLIIHGLWDIVLHRRNRVVSRSLSEFCAVLDLTLGAGILALMAVA